MITCALLCLVMINHSHANEVILNSELIITTEKIYDQQSLIVHEHGRFVIEGNGLLVIKNSRVDVTLSQANPFFILAKQGKLILENSTFRVRTTNIPGRQRQEATAYLVSAKKAQLQVSNNQFYAESIHTVGLIKIGDWDGKVHSQDHMINNNYINNFHGGLYLFNVSNSTISHNMFKFNSLGSINVSGEHVSVDNNRILFSGRFDIGDGILVLPSKNIKIEHNQISNGSCYGMQVIGGEYVEINDNTIVDGITYAIYISSDFNKLNLSQQQIAMLELTNAPVRNEHIIIANNYLGQNRYALAGDEVSNLKAHDNYIVQRFDDAATRTFFTNNDILFKRLINLTWKNNFYKEAFTQVNGDNLDITKRLYVYPTRGGVII